MKKFLVQRREFSHLSSNPYKQVQSWTPWRTLDQYVEVGGARDLVETLKKRGGLYEFRIRHGKETVE